MINPFLSIIIPAYNAVDVIDKCIGSIVGQSYTDFEVIVVNDCSKDSTDNIIEQWSEKDKRIKGVHLEKNGGVSRARNIGITYAKGEYITFIDADDYIDTEYFEKAFSGSYKFDLIVLGLQVGDVGNFDVISPEENSASDLLEVRDIYAKLDKERALLWGPYNKFYRKSIIVSNNLTFPSFSLGEDQCFVFKYFLYVSTIKTVPYAGYYYIRNESASLSRGVERSFEDVDQFLSLKFQLESDLFKKLELPVLSMDEFSERNLLFYMARVFGLYSNKYKIEPYARRKTLKKIRSEPWGKYYRHSNYGFKYNMLKPFILSLPIIFSDLILVMLFRKYYG
ncbi:Glycosyltransferase involved in cell wall bisynthesis [Arenibacter palladensis]|uniref:Glycosyltransferase involved in cell wall bisynthesis n=1 Tax=Arenibacter palladensis TaxID=237373 RepID=A0A1M5HNM8_9FLAO|nr:glycosyltransferase family 2 protein [Arenibacter palladensis]SHG17563.1 Glycosyltransferase involved in cell wall bisynthesis [Arenibacter palladensis]